MARPIFACLVSLALALPCLAPVACKQSAAAPAGSGGAGGAGGSVAPPPAAVPVAPEDFCKELARIACTANDVCCDGKAPEPAPAAPDGGTDGGGGAPAPGGTRSELCVARQTAACDATAGKLVTDPRTGYDPALGGAFVGKAQDAGKACWKDPLAYEAFLAVLTGTGKLGSDCTPEDTSPAALRVAALSCERGTACHVYLRADGQPSGTCEKRTDSACSHAFDCPESQWCDQPAGWMPGVWGQCRPLRADGWKCGSDLQCQSYACDADGKCAPAGDKSFCLTVLYSSQVKADQPLGYWRLGETKGGTAADASGNGHTGKRAGEPMSLAPGALAGDGDPATGFEGTDDAITIPAGILRGQAAMSVEGWVSAAPESAGHAVLSFGDARTSGAVLSVGAAGDALTFDLVDATGQSHPLASGAGTLTHDQWSHVVVTYDGSHAALYVDGASAAALDGVFSPRAGGALSIGSSLAGPAFFKGGIDEVAVYGTALTPSQVAEHHRIGKSGPDRDMWRFFRWLR